MTDISSVTTFELPKVNAAFANNVANSVGVGATTVELNNTAPYTDNDIVCLTIDPDTPKQATFVGKVNGSNIVDVVWTEGNLGASHDIGATVADYVSATHYALISKHLSKSLNADGSLNIEGAWTEYMPVTSGFSSTTRNVGRYIKIGSTVTVYLSVSGTSNTAYIGLNLPFNSRNNMYIPVRVLNNSTNQDDPGMIEVNASSNAAVVYRSFTGGGFVASGTKALHPITFSYEAI